jgi:hypothetical protein
MMMLTCQKTIPIFDIELVFDICDGLLHLLISALFRASDNAFLFFITGAGLEEILVGIIILNLLRFNRFILALTRRSTFPEA